MSLIIEDRTSAGHELARALLKYRKRNDVIVLALPRGGVPVGAAIAHELHAPLDIMLVRKLGAPRHEELAMGAIASGGTRVLNEDVIAELCVSERDIERVTAREQAELDRRMKAYRADRPWPDMEGICVILVDDGVATGATMRAAIKALRAQCPKKIIVAVPVAPFQTLVHLRSEADEVICLETPEPFTAISAWYASFPQLGDAEVCTLLGQCWKEQDARECLTTVGPTVEREGRSGTGLEDSAARDLATRPSFQEEVQVQAGSVALEGLLTVPGPARGMVAFVHGSGSSRFSSRNLAVARYLNRAGFATLLFDLLTADEQKIDERTGSLRFDIGLLTERLLNALEGLRTYPEIRGLKIGLFGASTGAAAALNVAATPGGDIGAVVSRGGRPDLAAASSLPLVRAPTLLIVGELDSSVIALNLQASAELICEHKVHVVPGASHLFEEPGTLEEAARVACAWFEEYLPRSISQTRAPAVTA